jgi:hypothetical protein
VADSLPEIIEIKSLVLNFPSKSDKRPKAHKRIDLDKML